MPAGADDRDSPDLVRSRTPGTHGKHWHHQHYPGDGCDPEAAGYDPSRHDHNILIDAEDDRWEWRRKIRADPRKLVFYRFVIGLAGLLLVVLGLVSGPLPGPGGIPLMLLGLAIWSSEFDWAQRVMERCKVKLHQFRGWTRVRQVLFWVVFFACCGVFGYLYLLVLGIPPWLPEVAQNGLGMLPGV